MLSDGGRLISITCTPGSIALGFSTSLSMPDSVTKEIPPVSVNFFGGLSSCAGLITAFDIVLVATLSICLKSVDLMRVDIRDKVTSSSTITGCR